MRTSFGRTLGIPRLRGLGALSSEQRDQLFIGLTPTERLLDTTYAQIQQAAAAGFEVGQPLARYDELSASLERLSSSVSALDEAGLEAWQEERNRLAQEIEVFRAGVASSYGSATSSRMWKIGIWAGAAAVVTAGAIAYLRSRRRRGA